jgi:hypothetical protein
MTTSGPDNKFICAGIGGSDKSSDGVLETVCDGKEISSVNAITRTR